MLRLFAALERAILKRWEKIKVALKVQKWPLLNWKEQRLQLKKQYLESLFRKKWQKFERSIYVVHRTGLPPCRSQYNTASWDSRDARFPWVQLQQGRTGLGMRLDSWVAICLRLSIRQYQAVSDWDSQSCATHLQRVGTLKSQHNLRLDCYN